MIKKCKEKNTISSCYQICNFREIRNFGEAINPNSIEDYNRLGFSKIDRLVDLESQPFLDYRDLLNSEDSYDKFSTEMKINELSFSEYKLKQYLERINNKSIKYIKPNIYYCNGKIYYYICTYSFLRGSHNLTSEEYNIRIRQDRLSEKYKFLNNRTIEPAASLIHLDYSNINNDNTEYINILTSKGIEVSDTCQQTQEYNTYQEFFMGIHEKYNSINFVFSDENINHERTLNQSLAGTYNGLESLDNINNVRLDIINNPQSNIFNIWLLLNKSDDDKTLGFFNMYSHITQGNSIQDLLKRTTNIEDSNSFNSLYSHSVPMPNVTKLGNDLYTFSMDKGSALMFDSSEIAHIGFTPESGIRISVESRYVLLPYDFDLKRVFKISPDGTRLLVKKNADNVPDKLPPYLPLTIYEYFQEQFGIIKDIYNQLLESKHFTEQITMDIFIHVLDNITFEDYMNYRDIAIRTVLELS